MSKQLIITTREKQKLSKLQQTFNRLVKRLENLQKDLDKTGKILREKLDFYGKHIHPLEEQLATYRVEVVKLLYIFYKDAKLLNKKDRDVLGEVISNQLSGIIQSSNQELDEELKEVFEATQGIGFEEAAEEEFAEMKDDMAETFQRMGIDVNLDDFHAGMSQEEMMRRMAEMMGKIQEQQEAQKAAPPKRKPTKKQLEKAERERQIEEAKSKSIASVYKQLARVFHPDLEQDPALKSQKEDLMKELTTAYEKNDLHGLLRLELQWIHKEENNLETLSDEKLSIYNQALKEQVEELQAEKFMMMQHPRYFPLQRFSMFPMDIVHINLQSEKRDLQMTIKDIEQSITELKGKNALKEVKTIIKTFKKHDPEMDFLEMALKDLFR